MAHADSANSRIRDNLRMRGKSVSRYKKIRSLYVGGGNESNSQYSSPLTKEELAVGRKRAKAYYTKRNLRIYTQIIVISILACSLVGFTVWYLLA